MHISSAEFVISNTDISKLPEGNKPEFAFIGRSNVGKSSLLNMLAARKGLAKTSATPGKTQLINHFLINNNWFMVDLPGYGFAKVSLEQRAKWEVMIMDYLTQRKNLVVIFVLVDIRVPPQKSDIEMINKLGGKNLVIAIIFTKCDKLTKSKVQRNADLFKTELLKYWEETPLCFFSSTETLAGREEILDDISADMRNFARSFGERVKIIRP